MQELSAFAFDDSLVRVIHRDGEPWFVLLDVCRVLEIGNPSQAASRLDDDEKGIINSDTLGGAQDVIIISESGLYSLILTSRKPEAKRFKKWVTSDLLPTLRKTGRYEGAGAPAFEFSPEHGDLQTKLSLVREARLNFGRATSRALWVKFGLPLAEIDEIVPEGPTTPAPVAAIVKAILVMLDRAGEQWSGTPTALLAALRATGVEGLPETSQGLGTAMGQVRGAVHDHGVTVSRIHSGNRRYVIRRGPPVGER